MDTIEAAQRQAVAARTEPQVAGLAQLRGIGVGSGWVLAKELFGWRCFRNRREVAGCFARWPPPSASGGGGVEPGRLHKAQPLPGEFCCGGVWVMVARRAQQRCMQ